MRRLRNLQFRAAWLRDRLAALPAGTRLLDVGAGECANKVYCSHLDYVSQDIAQYDGQGDGVGLQTKVWNTAQIDIVCDLYDIPEDRKFDAVLCTEVLEHVVDPVRAVEKLVALLRPGGTLIITAPFNSLTHFAPYHYATGLSSYFYRYHLERLGLTIAELSPNGGYFDFLDQELGRVHKVRRSHSGWPLDPVSFVVLALARLTLRLLAALDGPRAARKSSDLQTFGWHVIARKPD